jgi:hypothetical protein
MNPFPGMNPYLERYWRDVHASLIVYAREALQAQLPQGLVARIEERVYVEFPDESVRPIYPDIRVVERSEASGGTATAVQAATEPVVIDLSLLEPVSETYIEIVEPINGRLITVIEVLSLANKMPGEGREVYLRKQHELVRSGISLVEIDLLREGQHVLSIPLSEIPPKYRTPYMVCVMRGWEPHRREIYPITLQQPLPTVHIPLRRTDADVRLDLQALINRCYEIGRYDQLIDYRRDPEPPLDPETARWLHEWLVQQGRRGV